MEVDQGHPSIEIEANRFAVELLMPEALFKPLMAGSLFDFTLMGSLADQFYVSKHASGNRILDFIKDPYILICTKGFTITAIKYSRSVPVHRVAQKTIPLATSAYDAIAGKYNQFSFSLSDTSKWFNHCDVGTKVYEWTKGDYASNVAMTILKIE